MEADLRIPSYQRRNVKLDVRRGEDMPRRKHELEDEQVESATTPSNDLFQ